ncbi:SEC-C metal-binding domain-containing protein [Bacillus spongiae]|uniref:SEC-C metal-binding domain-containing protein n=1 Tax=Bacillus spongiae TaxID=2683610 RepID=A0ABU8HEY4_9BACI
MTQIGRNEPCLCGSGKKYKKCCGKANSVTVEELVSTELDHLQMQMMDYVLKKKDAEMVQEYQKYISNSEQFQKDEEIFEIAFTIWYLFIRKNSQGHTLSKQFIESQMESIQRPLTREIVSSWEEAPFIAGKISNVQETSITLQDALSGQTFSLDEQDQDLKENAFVIGVVLTYGEKQVLFGQYFIFPSLGEELFAHAQEKYIEGVHESFFTLVDYAFQVYKDDTRKEKSPRVTGKSKFNKASYEKATESLKTYLEENGEESNRVEFAVSLLEEYLERAKPTMRNPHVYAAATVEAVKHYLPKHVNLLQKEIAASFDVSPQSISKKRKEIVDAVEDMISDKEGLSLQQ